MHEQLCSTIRSKYLGHRMSFRIWVWPDFGCAGKCQGLLSVWCWCVCMCVLDWDRDFCFLCLLSNCKANYKVHFLKGFWYQLKHNIASNQAKLCNLEKLNNSLAISATWIWESRAAQVQILFFHAGFISNILLQLFIS